MPRKPRVQFDGAFYHVIVRGNQRQRIFRDQEDRRAYLQRVERYRQRYGFRLYAYVLMSNHVHLLVETAGVSLSKIMQAIQFTYTQYYNRRHRTVGHLFQGRYKALLCDRNAYLLGLVRYIHLNPARLRAPINPWNYAWSSHRAYMGGKLPVEVSTGEVLAQFYRRIGEARKAYVGFMREGLDEGHQQKYYEAVEQRFLGGEEFVKEVVGRAGETAVEFRGPKASFARLVAAVAHEHGADKAALTEAGRQRRWVAARAQLAYLAREWGRLTAREIGGRLHRDPSMVSRLCAWYEAHRNRRVETRLATLLKK